jgi:hypothetical protein
VSRWQAERRSFDYGRSGWAQFFRSHCFCGEFGRPVPGSGIARKCCYSCSGWRSESVSELYPMRERSQSRERITDCTNFHGF